MRRGRVFLLLFLAATTLHAKPGPKPAAKKLTAPPIAYKNRTLPNGLQLYSIEDHASPTVAIHVWYHVGSKDDPPGRSGFAHLFEHMMFKSTKNMPSAVTSDDSDR